MKTGGFMDTYDSGFTAEQLDNEASILVAEYLGNDDENWESLSSDLSLSSEDLEGLKRLYINNRKQWFERMQARAFVFWSDEIIKNLKGESNV